MVAEVLVPKAGVSGLAQLSLSLDRGTPGELQVTGLVHIRLDSENTLTVSYHDLRGVLTFVRRQKILGEWRQVSPSREVSLGEFIALLGVTPAEIAGSMFREQCADIEGFKTPTEWASL